MGITQETDVSDTTVMRYHQESLTLHRYRQNLWPRGWESARGLFIWMGHWDEKASPRPADSSLAELSDACLSTCTSLTFTGLNLNLSGTNDSGSFLIYELHL